jgi:hypothetical protein
MIIPDEAREIMALQDFPHKTGDESSRRSWTLVSAID